MSEIENELKNYLLEKWRSEAPQAFDPEICRYIVERADIFSKQFTKAITQSDTTLSSDDAISVGKKALDYWFSLEYKKITDGESKLIYNALPCDIIEDSSKLIKALEVENHESIVIIAERFIKQYTDQKNARS